MQNWNSPVGGQSPSESSLKSGRLLDGSGWVVSYSPEAQHGASKLREVESSLQGWDQNSTDLAGSGGYTGRWE